LSRLVAACVLALLALAPRASAQMTVSGQVRSAAGQPVQGASVSIAALNVSARTDASGQYHFIIRATQVMGQTVSITARHGRFGSQTVQVRLTGGALTQNFALAARDQPPPGGGRPPRDTTAPRGQPSVAAGARTDSSAFLALDSETPGDLGDALAGRLAQLRVTPSSVFGGGAFMVYRGPRTLLGTVQPLVVVDGIPVDNESVTTFAQRFGVGGYDYGTPLQDIALDDIATALLLDPVTASARYGSRAANGVLELTTKTARGITGWAVGVTQRFTGTRAVQLPEFQNRFGQGLGGQFEFFDGRGGGINDAVQESWGPLLDARPVVQHSLTEPGRPEVRWWLPQPDDTRRYFTGASTYDAAIALQGSGEASHLRAALNARTGSGITPGATLRRLGVSLNGDVQPSAALSATANVQLISSTTEQRPGTGFDEVNPVAGFTRMGRQVDLDALRAAVQDEDGNQINWIYTNRNNPFVATSLNANDDDRTHLLAGVTASYRLPGRLTMSLRGGTDDWDATRRIRVDSGWLSGFPTSLGRGDFTGGGTDEQRLSATERVAELLLRPEAWHAAGLELDGAIGAQRRANQFHAFTTISDDPGAGVPIGTTVERTLSHEVTAYFGTLQARGRHLGVAAALRLDQSSSLGASYSELYPAAEVSYDLAGAGSVLETLRLGRGRLIARVWRAGNEITTRTLANSYFPGTIFAPEAELTGPETTTGLEAGADLGLAGGRVSLAILGYRERSSNVMVAVPLQDGTAFVAQDAEVFNGGIESNLRASVFSGGRLQWDVAATHAVNASTVDALSEDVFEAPLAPELFGSALAVRPGTAAGVIIGSRLLRDAAGQLVLRNGLPIADASDPASVLGSIHPDWTATLRSTMRFAGAELSVLVDARRGGKMFSATNRWGSSAGTLASTLIGDRAEGATAADSLTVAGVDSVTGLANAVKVSAEQYFHALAGVTEPWVYDASFTRVREARLSYEVATRFLPGFREHRLRASLVGRNLFTWSSAPNIGPESTLSTGTFQGFEMGQLPGVRMLGIQVTIAP
jgi:hypothetical protein